MSNLPAQKDYLFPTSDYAVRHAWDRLVQRAGIENFRFSALIFKAYCDCFRGSVIDSATVQATEKRNTF